MISLPLILGFIIDGLSVTANQKNVEEAEENAKLKAIDMNRQVERNLKIEIKNFMERNPL
ncbi:hypothetical protein [Anabaena sp. UHCC 0451]|uniref:hypothetical protein n=1 Tax=Anabaena sp. UHCC 0451 TaxID=2055235 RepID=UPI002B20EE8A|nr:hypothetical protein [Anabaena sp. UHCC 0451]MEA5579175.1 hypothetical protein [Anabaena sp. UHCC 0451]